MILEAIPFFIAGLLIGSFLNVLICRIPNNESFLLSKSYCDNCKKNLHWYDLIPIISFLLLKGNCRFCNAKISKQIILVELLTAFLFFTTFFKFPIISIDLFFYLFIICSLIVIFFTDLKHGIIPNKILYPASIVTLIYILYSSPDFINHIASSLVSFLFFFLIHLFTKGKGMGFGDVKFAGFLGLLFGFPAVVVCLYTAFLTGGLVGLILIVWGKKRFKKDTIAFGPFLSFGALVTILLGDLLVLRLLSFLR